MDGAAHPAVLQSPGPGTTPNSIFITAMDTNPLAGDPGVIIPMFANEFAAGLDVLSNLTDGAVHVCHEQGKFLPTGNAERITAHARAAEGSRG